MSKIAEEKSIEYQKATYPMAIGGSMFSDMVDTCNINPAYIAGYDQSAKDLIARIRKLIQKFEDGLQHFIGDFPDGERFMIWEFDKYLSKLEKEYE